MNSDDLAERAVRAATACEAQGFHATAMSLRELAQDMLCNAEQVQHVMGRPGFAEPQPSRER